MSDYIPLDEIMYALLPILLGEDPVPYHDSILTGKLRYEELLATRNNHRFMDEVRMNKETFESLLSKLTTQDDLKDSLHIGAGEK